MAKTYANLKSDIASFYHRADLTTIIPTLVGLAEQEIFRTGQNVLRVREMESSATITLTNLVGSLPSDYLEAKYLRMTSGSAVVKYLFKPAEEWTSLGSPGYFTIIGTSVYLPNGATGTCSLIYYAIPAALSGDSDTNTILDSYYATYLAASNKQAAIYSKNDQAAAGYNALLSAAIMGANGHNKSAAGPLMVGVA